MQQLSSAFNAGYIDAATFEALSNMVGSTRALIDHESFSLLSREALRAYRLEYGRLAAPVVDDIMLANIGRQLGHLRKECGYTQKKAAAMASVALRSLQRIESGEKEPSLRELLALCALYGTSPERVIGWLTPKEVTLLDKAAMYRPDWMEQAERSDIARRLREWKRHFGLTNAKIAEGAGINTDTVSRILNADTTVKQATLNKVVDFFADLMLSEE